MTNETAQTGPFNGLADFVDGGCVIGVDSIKVAFNTTALIEDIVLPNVGTTIDAAEFKKRLTEMTRQADYIFEELLQLFKDELVVFKTIKTKHSPVTFLVALCGERVALLYED